MNLLVMGGTQFLGRAIVVAAIDAGHTVTLFNRGRSAPDLFPDVERLVGDRSTGDYEALAGRHFDAVIDVCAYYPRAVRELLDVVLTDHFTLISTISVYADNSVLGQNESGALVELADASVEDVTGETYGGLKVLCERAAADALPERVLHVRSGLIIGAHDPTDRFTYWPWRIAKGGPVLCPTNADHALQMIDARDEAEWIIRSVERGLVGRFNVTGSDSVTFGGVFEAAKDVSASDAAFIWMTPDFIERNEIRPWQELPLWMPPEGAYAGFHHFSIDAALAEGLTFRPISDTIQQILDWQATLPADHQLKMGFSAEREQELLALWQQ